MGSAFGWVIAVFGVVWLGTVIRGMTKGYGSGQRSNWVTWVAGALVGLGALGFFGSALLAVGMFNPPNSLELPPGYVSGVVTSQDGKYVVPIEPSGRIQIYDSQWKFLTGWQVQAEGGSFKVVAAQPSFVETFTGRGKHHYTFTDTGKLIAADHYSKPFEALSNGGRSMVVPTSPLLWPFSSPFLSMALTVVGFLLPKAVKRLAAPDRPQ